MNETGEEALGFAMAALAPAAATGASYRWPRGRFG